MWPCQARLRLCAPLDHLAGHVPAGATLTPDGLDACVLSLGAESWRAVAVWVGYLDVDFEVIGPPQLRDDLRALARRFTDAAAG